MTKIEQDARRMADAYLAQGEDAARAVLADIERVKPLKTYEYVVLTDTFRKLVGR